jgi:hypothetical protein
VKAIVSVQKVQRSETPCDPSGKTANPHYFRDAATRGRIQGKLARENKPYSGCPYSPDFANLIRKRSTTTCGRANRNRSDWMAAFEATAGFKFTPYVKKAS